MITSMNFSIRFDHDFYSSDTAPKPVRFTLVNNGDEISLAFKKMQIQSNGEDKTVVEFDVKEPDFTAFPEALDIDLYSIEKFTEVLLDTEFEPLELFELTLTDENGVIFVAEPEVAASANAAMMRK
ncbi:MAG: hypothetical protein K5767_08880 [Clostridia bacterium]|nr:hypothetical protein [Clostridia bacterium]